jgi:hypothetical protein
MHWFADALLRHELRRREWRDYNIRPQPKLLLSSCVSMKNSTCEGLPFRPLFDWSIQALVETPTAVLSCGRQSETYSTGPEMGHYIQAQRFNAGKACVSM